MLFLLIGGAILLTALLAQGVAVIVYARSSQRKVETRLETFAGR